MIACGCPCPMIAGIDEVGRGPLAGPVTAGAVMLESSAWATQLADSKTLTRTRRETLARDIRERAVAWSLGWASVAEIDRLNILQASLLAMRRALAGLRLTPAAAWVDGVHAIPRGPQQRTVVGGDAREPAISAASIIAKVARDQEMTRLDESYPGYELAQNSGYATAAHRAALQALGATPIHRRSFAPVRHVCEPVQIGLNYQ